MAILIALAALLLLRFAPAEMRGGMLAALALLLCLFAGLTLPDADQWLPLDHRSGFTHSALPALLALLARWARPAAAGLALGIGLHLSADFFPEAMTGFATIKLPLAGSIGPGWSYAWIGGNALLCGWIGALAADRELRNPMLRLLVLVAIVLVGLTYLIAVDGGWPALAFLGVAGWLAVRGGAVRLRFLQAGDGA